MKEIFGIPIKDAIMYGILAIGVIYVWWIEHKDILCPTLTADEETCKEEGGMSFSGTKPKPGDSCHTLMSKIHKAAGAEQAAVKWRKALILSTAIIAASSCILTAVPEVCGTSFNLPSWQKLYISILVGYAILLGSYMYYSYHVYGIAEKWIRDSLKQMEENGCIAKE